MTIIIVATCSEMLLQATLLLAACSWAVQSSWATDTEEVGNSTTAGQKEVIYLLTVLPYFNPIPTLNPSWDEGGSVQPAMDLAKDLINSNPLILEDYTLELVHGSEGCGIVTETALGFVKHAFPSAQAGYTGIIGPGCSTSTTSLSPITETLGVVLVHGGASPTLSNRTLHPHLLGILGSSQNFVKGFNKLIMKAGWKRVALLYDDSRLYYLSTKQLFVQSLPVDISLLFMPASFNFLPLDIIQGQLLRIVFIMCPLELTQRIMCLAVNNSMVHPDYQFAIMSHTKEELVEPISFTYNQVVYICSEEDMETALDLALFLNYNLVPEEGVEMVSNTTYAEYLSSYENYRERFNQGDNILQNSTYTIWATYFYDAVWAWALVLDNLTKSDPNFTINTAYGNVDQSRLIVEQFYRTTFQGMSGKISFMDDTGFTPRKINISRASEGVQHHIAIIDGEGHLRVKINESIAIDDSFRNRTLRENRGLAIFFNIISAIQILLVMFFHITTIVYHKKPSIKAASPKLLHMSYVGVYILLLGIFLWTLNPAAAIRVERRPIFCILFWTWFMPIGFTLTFCPVAMRTWRIYRIFKHYLNPGKLISDPILIGGVLVLLAVDLIIAVTWTTVDVYVIETNEIVMHIPGQASVIGIKLDCTCDYLLVWFGIIISYKVGILIVVAVFAVLTRKIFNRSFATTSLRVLVFLLAIIVPLGFAVYFMAIFLNLDGPMNYFSFTTLCILVNGISALCVVCIFVPPLVPLFRKYKKKVMSPVTSSSKIIL